MRAVANRLPRAVVWDVGDVLYDWDPRNLYRKLIADQDRLDWFLDHVVTRQWHFQHDAGRPFADTSAELIAEWPGEAELIRAFADRWLETIAGPTRGTHEILRHLHAQGVPQYAITNFSAEFWQMFRPTAPVLDLLLDVIVSGVEKLIKPDAAIYALAQQRFGLGAGDAVFIDDNIANVEAARRAGWHAVHFQGADRLQAELCELGLPA